MLLTASSSTSNVMFEWTNGIASGTNNDQVLISNATSNQGDDYQVVAKQGDCESSQSDVFALTIHDTPEKPVIISSNITPKDHTSKLHGLQL